MPLYEYQCEACGRFEVIRKFSDSALSGCPTCGNGVEKLPSAPAIQFKGTGWYITDYARKASGSEKEGNGDSKESKEPSKAASKDSSTPKTDTPTKSAAASSSTTK